MFSAAFVCGARRRGLPLQRAGVRGSRHRRCGGARGRLRPDRPDHRAVVGAQGVGRLVAVGRTADLRARAVADLRRVSAAAPLRRAGVGEAVRGDRAVRHGQRAVRLPVGERLADGAPQDDGGLDAAARHARAALVVADGVHAPVRPAARRPDAARGPPGGARRSLSGARGLIHAANRRS